MTNNINIGLKFFNEPLEYCKMKKVYARTSFEVSHYLCNAQIRSNSKTINKVRRKSSTKAPL